MAVQTVTLHLPETIYQRLQAVAATTRQPLETVIFQTIQGNLPPALDDLPPEMAEELAAWPTMSDAALWRVVRETPPPAQWRRHQALLNRNEAGPLTAGEREELDQLRDNVDRFVVRRSYALALLKWRGHTLPPPETLIPHAAPPKKNPPRRSAKRRRVE